MFSRQDAVNFFKFAEKLLRREQPQKFERLVGILCTVRVSPVEVRTEMEKEFGGEPLIIHSFNRLLPPALRIPSPVSVPSQAFELVAMIKDRERVRKGIYRPFLDLLAMYSSGEKSRLQVAAGIAELLKDQPDLRDAFLSFIRRRPDVESSGHVHRQPAP